MPEVWEPDGAADGAVGGECGRAVLGMHELPAVSGGGGVSGVEARAYHVMYWPSLRSSTSTKRAPASPIPGARTAAPSPCNSMYAGSK